VLKHSHAGPKHRRTRREARPKGETDQEPRLTIERTQHITEERGQPRSAQNREPEQTREKRQERDREVHAGDKGAQQNRAREAPRATAHLNEDEKE